MDSRNGLGRAEVLILLLIFAFIAANAVPWLENSRELARKRQCTNNLRQLGAALSAYHDSYGMLPPAALLDERLIVLEEDGLPERSPDSLKASRGTWLQLLLPYVGQDELSAQFDVGQASISDANAAARSTNVETYTCPVDSFNSPENAFVLTLADGSNYSFARSNYAMNGGSQTDAIWPGRLSFPVPEGNHMVFEPERKFQFWGSGVGGFNRCFSYKDFESGLSTTVAIDEIRAGLVPEDSRGVWALAQIGSSITWAHGMNGDAFGPNNQSPDSDDILEGKAIAKKYGAQQFRLARMPFCAHCSYANQATSRSLHEGGTNVLMADGSSRFIADVIDVSVWHIIHSRLTPEEVGAGGIENLFDEPIPRAEARAQSVDFKSAAAEEIVNGAGMKFRLIPAGTFMMGLPDANNKETFPPSAVAHEVQIGSSFYLGLHEVTQSQFHRVMGRNPSWHSSSGDGAKLVAGRDTSSLPVENVTWYEAAEFCKRLSLLPEEKTAQRTYRLPTEAEWEYACRSGSREASPFYGDWEDYDGSGEIAGKAKHPTLEPLVPELVGSHSANGFGIFDMRGNVFEWCNDWATRDYYGWSPPVNPQGPAEGYLKVIRGWDWTFIGPQCKDFLVVPPPWCRNPYFGFRVVCEPAAAQ